MYSKYGVSPAKERKLKIRMKELGIREEDLIEKFLRAGGPGGQRINKTSTCVYLKHLPTGIEVKCQKSRSQALNRFLARRILVQKIDCQLKKKLSEEKIRIARLRRQKQKRSKRAKEKILREKHLRAEKKKLRRPIKDYSTQ